MVREILKFHSGILVISSAVPFFVLFLQKKIFKISILDLLLGGIVGVVLVFYKWEINAEPEKLLFGGQLIILWFLLRYIFQSYPSAFRMLIIVMIAVGFAEALLGIMQLSGYKNSTHDLFRLTGTFINPGPYSGFLAIILPLTIGLLFSTGQKAKKITLIIHWFAWLCVIAILVVFPAGMSRSAWIAAILGCGWVYWWKKIGWQKTKESREKHRTVFLIGGILIFFVVLFAFAGIYSLKKDSADGRLLMWKITTLAIAKQPLSGVGLGGFPAAYAEEQAEYFASGKGTETEKKVAGCPEYAFNEYLQIALEQGIFGLLLFVTWMGLIIWKGIKNKQYGVTGSLVALSVFAFSSYPLQLPSFWILLVFLSVMALSPIDNNLSQKDPLAVNQATPEGYSGVDLVMQRKKKRWGIPYSLLGLFLLCGSFFLYYQQKDIEEAYRKWNSAQIMYNGKAYESAYPLYEELYSQLNHKPEFLFEAGQCLSKMGRYAESNKLLERATLLSSDPMIHYIIGKNEQMMGHCDQAEARLIHAIHILPERIYPYYLLTQLYADSVCYQPEKMREAADSVLYKQPKVMSTAIREMRREVKKILELNDSDGK